MNAHIPAEVFPPGEYLAEELEARNWSQTELAEILGRPPRLVNEIIAGKRTITPETAKGLSAAFGTSPEFWMNLETAYQLSKARVADEVSRRARLYGTFPVKELIKRKWIEASENIEVLEQRFLDFYGMSSMDAQPKFAHAARQTKYDTPASMLKLAWLNRAKQVARTVKVGKYSEKALRDEAIPALRAVMEYKDGVEKVSGILAGVGVRFIIVEHLPSSKMDGACFWNGTPVIALSLRFDRVDNFWFNLFHEIDHVLHGEGKDDPIYELIDQSAKGLPPIELRANDAAAAYCIPPDEMEGFIARVNPLFTKQAIVGFAARIHTHPGIVVGQLQHRKLIPYSFHHEMLEKIKPIVMATIITDGFGNTLPL